MPIITEAANSLRFKDKNQSILILEWHNVIVQDYPHYHDYPII